MKKLMVVLLILAAAASITSCNMIGLMLEDDTDRFVGIWEGYDGTQFVFRENGTCDISESPIGLNWSINSDKEELKIWSILWVFSITADYEFNYSEELEYTVTKLSILAREWYDLYETNTIYKTASLVD